MGKRENSFDAIDNIFEVVPSTLNYKRYLLHYSIIQYVVIIMLLNLHTQIEGVSNITTALTSLIEILQK